jgi:hypothetical protein
MTYEGHGEFVRTTRYGRDGSRRLGDCFREDDPADHRSTFVAYLAM